MEKRTYRDIYIGSIFIGAVLLALFCMDRAGRQQQEGAVVPDLVRTVQIDDCHHLTVVAGREDIKDKESLARLIVDMYRQDLFQTIKISRDRTDPPSRLYIKVYQKKEDIGKEEPVCRIRVEDGYRIFLDEVELKERDEP